ncbi:patatin-like phospholipase family protein [Mycolicibacterium mucogenicum]|uniref:patatin-like phospholipase family protein n=1 Tax=Mycolicibacterium mucogenicum TaxID=56689 RepID=UPI002269FE74|nr:patatin-like phospholipase family protein [Mycolicibacterium mucogenicum]MCX8560948.1 patatin-like phospholipase family protein [Mycolicibacterium mucogenicum]
MAAKRALVLSGGGIAGIAWETGILQGIADESPDTARALLDSDVLVGTSAGSTVAAQLGSGLSLDELYAREVAAESAELDPGVDMGGVSELFGDAMSTPDTDNAAKLQKIGRVALASKTVPAAVRREVIAARLPSHDWPQRVLRISATDIDRGELVSFDRDSGVGLVDAVAASCAVPGVWPVVTIGDRRYMDGGVSSCLNLVLATDCDAVVVLVPSGRENPSPFCAGAPAEVDGFAGAALGIFADDDAVAAFGDNPLDPSCRVPSAEAGRAQGRKVAAKVAEFLAG